MAAEALKDKLIKEVKKLKPKYLRQVLDFVGRITADDRDGSSHESPPELEPEKDPILRLLGAADVEPFSHDIDAELYGAKRDAIH